MQTSLIGNTSKCMTSLIIASPFLSSFHTAGRVFVAKLAFNKTQVEAKLKKMKFPLEDRHSYANVGQFVFQRDFSLSYS